MTPPNSRKEVTVPEKNLRKQSQAAVLLELSGAGLPESSLKHESGRWAELLVAVLHFGAGVDRGLAERIIGKYLDELGALEPGGLSIADADRRQFIQRVLVQSGLDTKSSHALCRP